MSIPDASKVSEPQTLARDLSSVDLTWKVGTHIHPVLRMGMLTILLDAIKAQMN